jgi:hypothetical protein
MRGNLTPNPPNPDAKRGEITRLSRAALNRLTARTRELEALGYRPDYLLTLTYPGNWRGALAGADAQEALAQFREHWARMEDLRAQLAKARKDAQYNPHNDWVLTYLRDEYKATKAQAKKTLWKLRALGPDGRKLKEHKNALLKRLDRKFGTQTLSVHRCYGAALRAAQEAEASSRFVTVKVRISDREGPWRWEVVGVLYRVFWWLEFQKRGAPHLHLILFDVREGFDWEGMRAWVGEAWAAVVAGRRSVADHSPAHNPRLRRLLDGYDQERELWGKALADAWLRRSVEALGLDWGIFNHVRAGTRMETMRKDHWGYAAKEAAKYASKKYQAQVPKNYRNVGRWWGHRNYRAHAKVWVNVPINEAKSIEDIIIKPLQAATSTLPPGCYRFKQKVDRFMEAARNGEPYGYITVWGQAAVDAALEAL